MNKLFNSVFENSLRILLLLAEFDCGQSLDKIYATDFMVTYGATAPSIYAQHGNCRNHAAFHYLKDN